MSRLASILVALLVLASWTGEAQAKKKPAPQTSLSWAKATQSPRSAPAGGALYQVCGARDLGLVQVAASVVGRRVAGLPPPSERQLETMMRAAGTPQVWPRAWSLRGDHGPAVARAKLERFVAKGPNEGHRRCGIARGVDQDGEPIVAAIVVDAVADLSPLPMRAAPSRWLRLDARLHREASDAKVVLLGPAGRPRRVLASSSNGRVRSRFTLDARGKWLVQVVATFAEGPRPVLEATVWVDDKPPRTLAEEKPSKVDGASPRPSMLLSLLNLARRKEGMSRLRRDPQLDRVARAHASAMMRARRAAHDVGEGPPLERARRAGLNVYRVGENVASAPTVKRVHRALWDSPSHRENMLDASFQSAGVALAIDRRGQIWAVQLFSEQP